MEQDQVLPPGHDLGAEPVERGCGTRDQGGVYAECDTDMDEGLPLDAFLADPPRQFTPDSAVGVDLVEGPDNRVHIFDYVGMTHYPWPADVIEEGRDFGFSRRLSKNIDLSMLSQGARLVLLHKRGKITNWPDVHPFWTDEALDPHATRLHCGQAYQQPHKQIHVEKAHIECSKVHWLTPPPDDPKGDYMVTARRTFASTSYLVCPPTEGDVDDHDVVLDVIDFAPAIIASVPITNISVIEADDGSHEDTVAEKREQLDSIPITVQPF